MESPVIFQSQFDCNIRLLHVLSCALAGYSQVNLLDKLIFTIWVHLTSAVFLVVFARKGGSGRFGLVYSIAVLPYSSAKSCRAANSRLRRAGEVGSTSPGSASMIRFELLLVVFSAASIASATSREISFDISSECAQPLFVLQGSRLQGTIPSSNKLATMDWRKLHGMKWQTVDLPNGINYHVWGSQSVQPHDMFTLQHSNTIHLITQAQLVNLLRHKSYGDLASWLYQTRSTRRA